MKSNKELARFLCNTECLANLLGLWTSEHKTWLTTKTRD